MLLTNLQKKISFFENKNIFFLPVIHFTPKNNKSHQPRWGWWRMDSDCHLEGGIYRSDVEVLLGGNNDTAVFLMAFDIVWIQFGYPFCRLYEGA